MRALNPNFWQERFANDETRWDRGATSPQLLRWLDHGASNDQLQPDADTRRIAVPGCGKGWEVVELAARGFVVTGIDYTPAAVTETHHRLAQANLSAEVVQADVLAYAPAQPFDAIYEQTCLCALSPDHWLTYAAQLQRWLRPGGRLYILFMQVDRPAAKTGLVQGPPFHCDITAMHALFSHQHWLWPDALPDIVPHPCGWHELAVCLRRK